MNKVNKVNKVKKKAQAEPSPEARRQSIAQDIEAFLKAGHSIDYIPDGVSGQDPQGSNKALKLGSPKK